MASHFFVLTLILMIPSAFSDSGSGPGPDGPGPINLTDILVKGGQYRSFLRLLNQTLVLIQLDNQLNNSNNDQGGMTLLAPTDNAFDSLPSGTLNNLNNDNKVKLALLHVLPKYYTMQDFSTVSNPVPTQGGSLGLNFTGGEGNDQVNVSSGVVETRVSNAVREEFPFAVYSIDKVLLFVTDQALAPHQGSSTSTKPDAKGEAPSSPVADGGADSPSTTNGGGRALVDLGIGIVMFCMTIF